MFESGVLKTRRNFLATSLCSLGAGFCSSSAFAKTHEKLPRALLLGDSISIGYTDFVTGILLDKVDIFRPLNANGGYENCEGTTKGKKKLVKWLGDGNWDVIHFNFGLHDLKHVDPQTGKNSRNPAHPQQADVEQYAKNLEWIVEKLVATKAKLVFATTTPYLDDPGGPLRRTDQPQKYNAAALPIMQRNRVMINDLHGFVLPRIEELLPPHNVHFKRAGSLELAKQVVSHINQALAPLCDDLH